MNRAFVVMPFGKKDSIKNNNIKINFDSMYEKAIKHACEELSLSVIRADEEANGGIIHVLMYERLVCANIAIVDITNENPNVYYELGFRHCARPYHTIIIFDKSFSLPFDIHMERAIGYELDGFGELTDEKAIDLKCKLQSRLKLAMNNNSQISHGIYNSFNKGEALFSKDPIYNMRISILDSKLLREDLFEQYCPKYNQNK